MNIAGSLQHLVRQTPGHHVGLVRDLVDYAVISQAAPTVLDQLVEAVVEELGEQDVEVEFETSSIEERIEFLIHVLGTEQASTLVRDAIDHGGALPEGDFESEDDEDTDD